MGQRGQEPRGQTVCVHSNPNLGSVGRSAGDLGPDLTLQQGDGVIVLDQAQAGLGGAAWLAALDQNSADLLLKRLDPLRDRGLADMQLTGSLIEGAAPMNGGKGGQMGRVKH